MYNKLSNENNGRNLIIDISESNKGKEQIIINKKYKFNFSYIRKDNSKKEILKYDSSHNHPEKQYNVSLSIMKHKIKDGIEKSSIPFGIKIKPLYNKISKEMRGEIFIIFKDSNLIIFQSSFQAKLFRKYNDDIFLDGIFFIAPKFSYQIFITRT
ncbi:hypothetical protein U3516DRAFT_807101 [Neocallimastix sp. 'constans']